MLIGIDGNEANVERKVGVSEFAFELLQQFKDSNLQFQIYLKNKPLDVLPVQSENWQYRVFGPKFMWTQWRLPLDLVIHRPRPSVFFTPTHYAPRFSPIPTVVSVMDLSHEYYPELFIASDLYQLRNWTRYSVKNAQTVITISNASRNDIMKLYHKDGSRIRVVYPGIKPVVDLSPHIYAMSELKTKFNISENYILYVGTLQPRKNVERLIEAFSILVHDNQHNRKHIYKDLELVLVGKKGWQYDAILNAPEKFNVTSRVKFLDFVPNEDLALLYKHARLYILPSLYEGFGLPILEAMKYGCPVITSNVSSMPEVGGDAALYVDPTDTADIVSQVKKLIESESLRHELVEKGKKQLKKFSWEKAARETLEILADAAKSND